MANLLVKDGASANQYLKATGTGTNPDPFVPHHTIEGVAGGVAVPVMGTVQTIAVTLTVTNGAYTIADVVGGLITFPNAVSAAGKSCVLNSLTLAGVVAIPYEVWFFSQDIATPRLDNAVFGLAAADGAIFLGHVPILASDYYAAQTAFNNACVRGIGLQMKTGATRNIYAYMKATAVTSPGTNTLYMKASFEQLD